MTFLTNEQQQLLQKHYEMMRKKLIEASAQFHFQTQQIELQEIIERALEKPSPPYRGCGLVEDRICENMNK